MSSAGLNIEDLRLLVTRDLEASNELQARIDYIRKEVESGSKPTSGEISALGVEHKEIGRDLVRRIEQIEGQKTLTAADRNMLQALTARLGVHDLQSARIAELGDLLTPNAWLESEALPKGAESKAKGASKFEGPSEPLLELATPSTGSLERAARSPPGSLQSPGGYHEEGETEDDDDDADSIVSNDGSESRIDKSSWPLLYRILDIDPDTPEDTFEQRLESRYKALEMKHEPSKHPNDASAPERWNAINKAYSMLSDEGRRRFYDARGNVPKDLRDFDLSTLSIED